MKEAIWRRHGLTMVPASDTALEDVLSVKEGELCILGRVRRPRSIKQLRLFWGLVEYVLANDESYTDKGKESVRWDIFEVLGEMEELKDRFGATRRRPRSIAFESMKASEFNDLFSRSIDVVCRWTGNQPKEVRDHVFEMVADKHERRD